jgi:hypothetical protein
VLSSLLLAGVCPLLHAASPTPTSTKQEAAELATRVDQLIGARLASEKVAPAPLADDAEFLRRISLDLTGRIPTVAQVRAFLQDQSPAKRQRLVDEMLNSGAFVRHFTHVWRAILLPDTKANDPNLAGAVETWLRQQVQANAPYDRMVRDLLRPGVVPAFSQAYENKPENLAAATSRIFLGLRVECAQCHDAKTEPWTREQFWGLAAFFAPSPGSGRRGQVAAGPGARSIRIPGTDKEAPAKFLDGKEPNWSDALSPRSALAEWVTASNNPYFARAAVNRLWAHFHGIGLVEPVDDLDEQNPASHPELFDELARQFTAHQFDLRYLVRAIVLSQTYQRTSRLTRPGQEDTRLFARMAVRGLTAEQLFDSLAVATGFEEPQPARGQRMGKVRAAFLTRFAHPGAQPTEFHLSILQALALMNGTLTAEATDLERSTTLAAVLDAPFMDNAGRIDTLYLAALGRKPRPEEAARMLKYVADGGADGRVAKAFADVFWVLLNSGEFILNH